MSNVMAKRTCIHRANVSLDRRAGRSPLLCRFLDAGMTNLPRAVAAGVQKAPRHEVAGGGAPAGQRALWGFEGGAELEGGCDADRPRPGDLHAGEIRSV